METKTTIREYIRFTFIVLFIVLPIRFWIAQPFIVSGASMVPTFENGDYLIIDELSYHLRTPQKGEVIIFRYPLDPSKFFIKRIIGVPGDTVEINGGKILLKDNEYYVLGDNRNNSLDSRIWGTLDRNLIVGRALVRLWPITDMSLLPGQDAENYDQ
ncbi:MAG: signal peptidase I [Patescibacteria group bacterium]